jgi:3,4-dihydroxy 2-butanone 4-phosphate synthase/GTP cyclohydrolase II
MCDKSIERVEAAIAAIGRGEMVILVDDEDRENEGDLVLAAQKVTPEAINFMATYGKGLICLTMTGERLDQLEIPMMVSNNSSPFSTAFTVSIEAATGVTTGISAADRSRTIEVAIDPNAGPADLVMPGHIFPLRARDGGVLVRTGQTEGSVDLARMAGLEPAGVICEIMKEDGSMARMPDLEVFAKEHGLLIVSVADMINYRLQRESLIETVEERVLETEHPGDWKIRVVRSRLDGSTHMCFICGEPSPEAPTLVRVQHRADIFDVFTSAHSESYETLRGSMHQIGAEGTGVIVYLDKDNQPALDLVHKHLGAPEGEQVSRARDVNRPQDALRDLGLGAQILVDAGVQKMRLLTNRPKRIFGLEGYGLEVVEQCAIDLGGAVAKAPKS